MSGRARARDFRPEPLNRTSAALALLASALWGGNLVALKLGLELFPPFWSAWWRFLIGLVVLGVWARLRGEILNPRPGEFRPLAILGVLFAAQIILLNVGQELTSPAYGAILLNTHPLFSNLVGHFVVSEQRLDRGRALGLALAFGGVCYLALGRPVERLAPNPLLGNTLLVASAFLLGIRTVYTRWIVQGIEPVKTVVWQSAISLPLYLLPALLLEPPITGPLRAGPVAAILYQGLVVASICFMIWTTLLRRHSAGTLAMFGFTVPVFGILMSALIFGEPVTARILTAGVLVMLGIAVVLRR